MKTVIRDSWEKPKGRVGEEKETEGQRCILRKNTFGTIERKIKFDAELKEKVLL